MGIGLAFRMYLLLVCIVGTGLTLAWFTYGDSAEDFYRVPPTGFWLRDKTVLFDGQWYMLIATEGYTYDSEKASSVAFFPLYPLLGRLTRLTIRTPADVSLLVVSHGCLLGSLWVFQLYLKKIYLESRNSLNGGANFGSAVSALLAFACFPTSFFLIMGYSESLFLLLTLLALYGMRSEWPIWLVAVIVGASTAARPVGVALVPPLFWWIWQRSTTTKQLAVWSVIGLPIAIGGLLLYMVFLNFTFDEPLAFAQTQRHWVWRTQLPVKDKIAALLSLEPFYAPYVRLWPTYWARQRSPQCMFASIQAANPAIYGSAVLLIIYGYQKKWLTVPEFLTAAGMLGIPYLTRAYEMNMQSHGRFVLPVFPVFIVLGRIISMWPRLTQWAYFTASGVFLVVFSWMWASGYFVI